MECRCDGSTGLTMTHRHSSFHSLLPLLLAAHMPKDLYAVLGLQRSASLDDIKKAYRRLSKELHPDRNKGDKTAEGRFKEVNEAYEVLSDPKKRQMYDQFGTKGGPSQGFSGGAQGFDFSGFDFSGVDGLSDLFEGFFGGRGTGGRGRDRGQDHEVEIQIPFMEAVNGAEKELQFRRMRACTSCSGAGVETGSKHVTCKTCGGTGQVTRASQSFFGTIQQRSVCSDCRGAGKVPEHRCKICGGEGRVQEHAHVPVKIPPGIDEGQTLRLQGEGDAGRQGKESGDLFVHIRITPDPRFTRDGDDIRANIVVPLIDAILGGEVEVETVHGPVKLEVAAGTQPGQVLRVRGKGMPVLSSSRFGDHYAQVQVEIPKKVSRAQRTLLEEWRKMRGD